MPGKQSIRALTLGGRVLSRALALALALAASGAAARADSAAGLERIRALEGRWEGVAYWDSRPQERLPVTMTYTLSGRGSTVIESFDPGDGPLMTSVYHPDGDDLRMTHFCGTGNQPRLRATSIEGNPSVIRFSFVDITNLAHPGDAHVRAAELHFVDTDRLTVKFVFKRGESEAVETIELTRAAPPE